MPSNESRSFTSSIEYMELEDQALSEPEECKLVIEITDSTFRSKFFKYFVFAVIGLSVAFAVLFVAIFIAVIIRAVATTDTGFGPDTLDFALYKNSRFKECYSLPSDAANCSAIRSGLKQFGRRHVEGFGYVDDTHGWGPNSPAAASHPSIYDWCQIVSCFNGFKMIPSKPRPSASIFPDILCSLTIMGTSISALQTTGKQLTAAFRKEQKPCRGRKELSWFDFVVLAYDVCGPIFWWWVSFVQFAVDPAMSTATSITAWVSTWKMGSALRFHPYSCALPGGRRTRRFLPWILDIAALLQWIASVYILTVYWGDLAGHISTLESYDCLEYEIPNAPGSSPCSVETLCSKGAFFHNGSFLYDRNFYSGRFTLLFFFFVWTLMVVAPFFFLGFNWIDNFVMCIPKDRWKKNAKNTWRIVNLGPNFYLFMASFVAIMVGASSASKLLARWDDNHGRDGFFIFHDECNALHVPYSAWQYYLDVSDMRVFRIIKALFNA